MSVVGDQAAASGLLLKFFGLLAGLLVAGEEHVMRLPVTLDQRVLDEQVAGGSRIDVSVVDLTRSDDRQAVEADLFRGHDRRLSRVPVRLAVTAAD